MTFICSECTYSSLQHPNAPDPIPSGLFVLRTNVLCHNYNRIVRIAVLTMLSVSPILTAPMFMFDSSAGCYRNINRPLCCNNCHLIWFVLSPPLITIRTCLLY